MRCAVVPLLAVAVLAGGCGSADHESDRATEEAGARAVETVQRWIDALESKDSARACELMYVVEGSPADPSSESHLPSRAEHARCRRVLRAFLSRPKAEGGPGVMIDADVAAVEVSQDVARVQLSGAEMFPRRLVLRRFDGEWRVPLELMG